MSPDTQNYDLIDSQSNKHQNHWRKHMRHLATSQCILTWICKNSGLNQSDIEMSQVKILKGELRFPQPRHGSGSNKPLMRSWAALVRPMNLGCFSLGNRNNSNTRRFTSKNITKNPTNLQVSKAWAPDAVESPEPPTFENTGFTGSTQSARAPQFMYGVMSTFAWKMFKNIIETTTLAIIQASQMCNAGKSQPRSQAWFEAKRWSTMHTKPHPRQRNPRTARH